MEATVRPLVRTPEPRVRRIPYYWLITRYQHNRMEVMTAENTDGSAVLPVFGSEEGARAFLARRAEEGWRPRKTGGGELVSVLLGPCERVRDVVLDPPADAGTGTAMSPDSVDRESFLEPLLGRGRSWFHDTRNRGLASLR